MELISRSINDTLKIGRAIAKGLKPEDIVCLSGNLGSGKTVLTKGIAMGLGIEKRKVISSSFILIRQHNNGKIPFYHFDLYRLKSPADIMSLGYEDYLYTNGIAVIEWADKLGYLLPKEYLGVKLITRTYSQRLLKFTAYGARYKELIKEVRENFSH
ncbi:MAG: tRNA (adenosine(37)-N6)-threonylcarbamoyltransferase complex ATPase subunit type 1 TsaE [Candidatus Omnitrophica bacterium]|nr:tRNA (adenosine(37)-N6)-threonylcarbamoyltransferase complex ATPase subunit type 1 TsaE [Candidatus Omnitrophota bacterium]